MIDMVYLIIGLEKVCHVLCADFLIDLESGCDLNHCLAGGRPSLVG